MGRMKLFDDKGDSSDDDLSKIEVNHEYAKRLEHNKKREELQRYEELKKQGRINDGPEDESSEDDDEDEELFKPSKKLDSKFFDALIKIKKKDPILNDKDAKLFDSDDSDESDDSDSDSDKGVKRKNEKKKKPMYLKDVVSKQLIETGPEFDDEEESDDGGRRGKVKTYSDEQEELKREFLKAVEEEESEDDGELFKVKDDGNVENEEEGEEEIAEQLDVIFGEDGKLDDDNKFLKNYFRNKMWIDDNGKGKDVNGEDIELSEDEEAIEKQEDYEREFNFRHEENTGDRVEGHARKVEGSVRKVNNARKSQRERKEERMVQAEFERKEELKRLKNLKRKEIREKLDKIRKVAGIGSDANIALDVDDLEKDFDPEEHDRKMKEAYDDEYYGAQDVDSNFGSDEDDDGVEKPDFDKEDELLGLSKGWDEVEESSDADQNSGSDGEDDGSEKPEFDNEDEFGEDGDNDLREGKRKRKRKSSEVEKAKMQLMDEYHKLDYEGVVGDLKTRFRYKPVPAKRFGLSTAELLLVDEKELNQHVPLKKLAPYQQEGWKVPRVKILELKKKIKESGFGETSKSSKKHKKSRSNGEGANEGVDILEDEKSIPKESNGEVTLSSSKRSKKDPKPTTETSKSSKKHKKRQSTSEAATDVVKTVEDEKSLPKESNDETTLSRKAKRRRKMKDLKPNESRLQAYGLI